MLAESEEPTRGYTKCRDLIMGSEPYGASRNRRRDMILLPCRTGLKLLLVCGEPCRFHQHSGCHYITAIHRFVLPQPWLKSGRALLEYHLHSRFLWAYSICMSSLCRMSEPYSSWRTPPKDLRRPPRANSPSSVPSPPSSSYGCAGRGTMCDMHLHAVEMDWDAYKSEPCPIRKVNPIGCVVLVCALNSFGVRAHVRCCDDCPSVCSMSIQVVISRQPATCIIRLLVCEACSYHRTDAAPFFSVLLVPFGSNPLPNCLSVPQKTPRVA